MVYKVFVLLGGLCLINNVKCSESASPRIPTHEAVRVYLTALGASPAISSKMKALTDRQREEIRVIMDADPSIQQLSYKSGLQKLIRNFCLNTAAIYFAGPGMREDAMLELATIFFNVFGECEEFYFLTLTAGRSVTRALIQRDRTLRRS